MDEKQDVSWFVVSGDTGVGYGRFFDLAEAEVAAIRMHPNADPTVSDPRTMPTLLVQRLSVETVEMFRARYGRCPLCDLVAERPRTDSPGWHRTRDPRDHHSSCPVMTEQDLPLTRDEVGDTWTWR